MTGAISSGSQQWPAAYSAPDAIEIEMEFHGRGVPAMHRALDHRGRARVIGPADRRTCSSSRMAAMAERFACSGGVG